MAFIRENGFPTADFDRNAANYDEISALIDQIEARRESLDFLIDGAVVKVRDVATRQAMGYTDKFPRWAIAYKFAAEENTSTLLDVTWELGRTGKLTPVAHLTPVDIGGVTVPERHAQQLRRYSAQESSRWLRGLDSPLQRCDPGDHGPGGRARAGRAAHRAAHRLPRLRSAAGTPGRAPVLHEPKDLQAPGRGAPQPLRQPQRHGPRHLFR